MAGNDAIALPTPVPSAAPSAAPSVAPSPSASAHAAESPDAETKETADTKVASAVREKGGHKKCLMSVLDGHPGWKPKYELVVHLLADGHVKKVVVDKKKSDTSVPEFFTCLVKQLEGETFPAPGREVSARLSYHAH